NKPNQRNVAQWIIRASMTLPFIKAIRPFLRMKSDQADLAIAFQKTKKSGNRKQLTKEILIWREKQRAKMRELNARAWI
ncbi:MAG: hypothetical protein AABY22_01625, partial [Nanoarchaeota archaeon]